MNKHTELPNRKQKGQAAEEAAALFLLKQGYKIIQRNFRTRYGEIDIIAQEGEELVFVEVRSLSNSRLFGPADTLNHAKQVRLRRLARIYLSQNCCLDTVCRFDVVAVIIDRQGRVNSLELIKDAFC